MPTPRAARTCALAAFAVHIGASACDPAEKPAPDAAAGAAPESVGVSSPTPGPSGLPSWVPGATLPPPSPEDCAAAGDEDRDGFADCADAECWGPSCPEDCDQRGDEDGDWRINCEDSDCWGSGCAEDCARDGDEDADGLLDCEDTDCLASCTEDCSDRRDNDRDGLTDCSDPDCSLHRVCLPDYAVTDAGGAHFTVRSGYRINGPREQRTFQTVSAVIDHLELRALGGPHSDSGAPCVMRFNGLDVHMSYAYVVHPGTSTGGRGSSLLTADSIDVTGAGCPIPADVEATDLRVDIRPSWVSPRVLFAVEDLPRIQLAVSPYMLTPRGLTLGPLYSEESRDSALGYFRFDRIATWSATASGFTIEHY
jgi:hypothetical protein